MANESNSIHILSTYFARFIFASGFPLHNSIEQVRKGAKIRSRNNQVPHPTLDTNGKVTNSQKEILPVYQ